MLDAIRGFFSEHLAQPDEPAGGDDDEHRLQLATAALLIEVTRVERQDHPDEAAAVEEAVRRKFALPQEETEELLRLAREEAEKSVSYYEFTSLIHEHFAPERKARVIELMWRVAAANGRVDKHQEALVRKIADLLYVPHQEFIRAKIRGLRAEGIEIA
ncbi:TerB family tellurite resistance protein [Aquisalimonas sp. 2447]|uniref:tellurite resistance TerB family protein n=1 Tax=Aquisalimonas sp. 2447 TaxID=2740807 RepID=UPI0014325896|nr:TerB family tellurite resistance protein [Aquisalimonas sp. 2447]QIT54214.1 TerB family tellurite resistance protein [Aquisalimonas sp. 2447]